MTDFSICLAVQQDGGIGNNNRLPWPRIAKDLDRLHELIQHASKLIVGRKTHEGLKRMKRFKQDTFVIVSSTSEFKTFKHALDHCKGHETFVLGGRRIFQEAMESPFCKRIFWTSVLGRWPSDVQVDYHPDVNHFHMESQSEVHLENTVSFQFKVFVRRHPEEQYLRLLQRNRDLGCVKTDRTGTGTLALVHHSLTFSLRPQAGAEHPLPLLANRALPFQSIKEELLWMIRGCCDSKKLSAKKCKFWDKNSDQAFFDQYGVTDKKEGDCGPIYPHQWRHCGAAYDKGCEVYEGGTDQLANVIRSIQSNPDSRRHVVCSWNVSDLPQMGVAPCHCLFQLFVFQGELSLLMYQRSGDLFLGVPTNIASYSMLTHMIAQVTGLKAGDFHHVLGDAHVYTNHLEQVDILLSTKASELPPFPNLVLDPDIKNIDDFDSQHIQITGYLPIRKLTGPMAV